jgi:hypothetical protein
MKMGRKEESRICPEIGVRDQWHCLNRLLKYVPIFARRFLGEAAIGFA